MRRTSPVDSEDKGRGYEIDKGVFIQVEDEEIEAIQVESKHCPCRKVTL
jgi:DNA end-binding protein Ku